MLANDSQPARYSRLANGLVLLVLLLALALRLIDVGVFSVVDEQKLAKDSTAFYNAISTGDLPSTFQRGHPAVLTMWLGTIAAGVQSIQRYGQLCETVTIRPKDEPTACALGEAELLGGMHVGYALFTWGLLVLCAIWLVRLYGPYKATLLVALLALDPFILAHSRLAHHEGILSQALLASCLALVVYTRARRPGLLIASAALGGLATVEKLPGLYSLAVAGGLLLAMALKEHSGPHRRSGAGADGDPLPRCAEYPHPAVADSGDPLPRRGRGCVCAGEGKAPVWPTIGRLALWALVALGVILLVWPALWSAPVRTLQLMRADVGDMVGDASVDVHLLGGQIRAASTGLLLYALTLVYRLTPMTLIGLALGLGGVLVSRAARRELGPWLVYAAGFILIMSLGVKQGGRYILAAFAAIDLAAGLAWWRIAAWIARRAGFKSAALRLAALGGAVALCLAYILPTAPYYLTCYNALVGGPRAAQRNIGIGLGEGLDQAARYLNTLPDARELVVSSGYREAFAPHFVGESHSLEYESIYASDYAVFYIGQWQSRPDWSLWQTYRDRQPVHVVTLQGIVYARVYANAPPAEAIAYVTEQATPQQLVVAEIPSLWTRHYAGAAPLWLPAEDAEEEAVRAELEARVAQADGVWWVVYPKSRGEAEGVIQDVLEGQTQAVTTQEFGELRVERRER